MRVTRMSGKTVAAYLISGQCRPAVPSGLSSRVAIAPAPEPAGFVHRPECIDRLPIASEGACQLRPPGGSGSV